jgi:formylglycine-generating enzyme required for sulfatase activity
MITDIVFASKEFPLGDTGLNIEMMKIPAGVFLMGSLSSEQGRDSDEGPAHEVHIETPFWISTKEVTKNQWEAVTGYDPCYFSGANYPVESVSFEDVNVFLDTLNAQSGVTWSLPSEAQWEYACRAGTITRYSWGYDAELSTIGSYSWFQENAGSAVYSVGQLLPNPWGLYDMNGNVYEWCQDTYHDSFNGAPAHGGAWTDTLGEYRVIRGGSFASDYSSLRSAFRYFRIPQDRFNQLGFRLVINVLI